MCPSSSPIAQTSPAAALQKLDVADVSKRFKSRKQSEVHALEQISLQVTAGEFICLVGSSGCGKTTLLRMIAGLDKPDTGQILLEGNKITGPGPDRMVMFQESSLFPWLNVYQNIEFGLKLDKNISKTQRAEIVMSQLELVGLKDFAQSRIHELSGGMKQRVALARALAPNPRMLLMDEPFAALDAMTREQLYFDLQRIWAARGKTIILVTHNVREAACLGDRVFVFTPRPGRLSKEFKVDLPRPRDINSPKLAAIAAEIKEALRTSGNTEQC